VVKLKRQYNRIAMPVEAFDLLQVRRNVFVSLSFFLISSLKTSAEKKAWNNEIDRERERERERERADAHEEETLIKNPVGKKPEKNSAAL